MNVHHKISSRSYISPSIYILSSSYIAMAIFGLLCALLMLNSAHAAPCFDNPQRAYAYLLAQENTKIQARDEATVNINRASEGELVSLNGIGSSKAQAIILYREMFGEFKTVDELAKVKGIGTKTLEKNRRRLSVQD